MSDFKSATRFIYRLFAGWFLLALIVGLSGIYYGAAAPVIGATNFTLTALVLLAFWRVTPVRTWFMEVDLRVLIGYHVVRFVGILFLIYHAQGKLPNAFAIPAGWGDIIVAVLAIVVIVACFPLTVPWRRKAVLLWNIIGLLDILGVLFTGIRLGLADRTQMLAFTELPLVLLPTCIVPLILATHVIIFIRLRKAAP